MQIICILFFLLQIKVFKALDILIIFIVMGNKNNQTHRNQDNQSLNQSRYSYEQMNFEFPDIQKYNKINSIKLQCKDHNLMAHSICTYRNCKNSLGVCSNIKCQKNHLHDQRNNLISLQQFNLAYKARSAIYESYCDGKLEQLNKIYEVAQKKINKFIRTLKRDYSLLLKQYNYCRNLDDQNHKLIEGRLSEVEEKRQQIYRFYNTSNFTKKILQSRFEYFNSKLKKRSQFNSQINQIFSKISPFGKLEQDAQNLNSNQSPIFIQNNKWELIFQEVYKLKDFPTKLNLACNVIIFDNIGQLLYLRQRQFISYIKNNYLDFNKFKIFLESQKMKNIKQLTFDTAWHIKKQASFEFLAGSLSKLQNLKKVTIFTRQPISPVELQKVQNQSFSIIKDKINIFSNEQYKRRSKIYK